MYEQMSFLKEFGIEDQEEKQVQIHKNYANHCGGCLCEQCANNVDCFYSIPSKEMQEPCFNCDDCYYYNGKGDRNKKHECKDFIITEYAAMRNRETFKII